MKIASIGSLPAVLVALVAIQAPIGACGRDWFTTSAHQDAGGNGILNQTQSMAVIGADTGVVPTGSLRGGGGGIEESSETIQALEQAATSHMDALSKLPSVTSLTPAKQVSLVKTLTNAADELVVAFEDLPVADLGAVYEAQMKNLIRNVKESKTDREKLIALFEEAVLPRKDTHEEAPDATNKEDLAEPLVQPKRARFNKDKKAKAQKQPHRRAQEDESRSKTRFRNQGSGDKGGFQHDFGKGDFKDAFGKGFLNNIHDVLYKASPTSTASKNLIQRHAYKQKSGAASLLGRHVSPYRRGSDAKSEAGLPGRRKLAEVEDKYHMCMQLATCVESMSLYDLFVYTKSDDIDSTTGEVDANRVVFDEADLFSKYERVKTLASQVRNEGNSLYPPTNAPTDAPTNAPTPQYIRFKSTNECFGANGQGGVYEQTCEDDSAFHWWLDTTTQQIKSGIDGLCLSFDRTGDNYGTGLGRVQTENCFLGLPPRQTTQQWSTDSLGRIKTLYQGTGTLVDSTLEGKCIRRYGVNNYQLATCTTNDDQQTVNEWPATRRLMEMRSKPHYQRVLSVGRHEIRMESFGSNLACIRDDAKYDPNSGVLLDRTPNAYRGTCSGYSGSLWKLDWITMQLVNRRRGCLDIDTSGSTETPNVLQLACDDSKATQKWYIDEHNRLRTYYSLFANKCLTVSSDSPNVYMADCNLNSHQTVFVPEGSFPDPSFCQIGLISAAGGTCCDSSCTQCGGNDCSGQCCTGSIMDYCSDSSQTSCKAPTEVKLSVVKGPNCTVEVWPATDDAHSQVESIISQGVYSFYSLGGNSSMDVVNIRVEGENCSGVDITRLEVIHRPSETGFKAGEFSEGLAAADNPPFHGYTLTTNRLHTFDFHAGDGWEDHYWEAVSTYIGAPTQAPTFNGFCETGVLGSHEGEQYCCDSDCFVCAQDSQCSDRGGNHKCCPENIDRQCYRSEDTGCKAGDLTLSPSLSPSLSSSPSHSPSLFPTLSHAPSIPPSLPPSLSSSPSHSPSLSPSESPSADPSSGPTSAPTMQIDSAFCQIGLISAAGGTCCDSSCTQCGGNDCSGQCCTGSIMDYCSDSSQTSCKAPREVKLSVVKGPNCTVEVWPASDDAYSQVESIISQGVYSFYSLGGNSSMDVVNIRVEGENCSGVDITRLEVIHRPSTTDFKAGEFSEGLAAAGNPPFHGYTLTTNRLHTFDFHAGDGWEDHYWEAVSTYIGAPTQAPTFNGFCETGVLGSHDGEQYCCDSDCLVCAQDSQCSNRGGNNKCCPENIDHQCYRSDDTGCKAGDLTLSPTGMPSQFPTLSHAPSMPPSLSPSLSSSPSHSPSLSPSESPSADPSSGPTSAPTMQIDSALEGPCNSLLQEFHRTVEHQEVPKWEGATVGQVCLAEGTTTFVKLGDAAAASVELSKSTFRDDAWTRIQPRFSAKMVGQWRSLGDAVWKSIAANVGGQLVYVLDSSGRLWYSHDYTPEWFEHGGAFTTPLVKLDLAGAKGSIGVDANGELFLWGPNNGGHEDIGGNYNIDQVSVGRDGTIWGVDQGTDSLCIRDGSTWSCDIRPCGLKVHSVHVADKNNIYVAMDYTRKAPSSIHDYSYEGGELYHFQGWKDGEFGVADCSNSDYTKRTFREVQLPDMRSSPYFHATSASVAVDDSSKEQAVYLAGFYDYEDNDGYRQYDMYVLDKTKNRYADQDPSESPWVKLGSGKSVAGDGNGGLLFTTKGSTTDDAYNWTGSNLDEFDWDNFDGSTYIDYPPWERVLSSAYNVKDVSAAINGDECLIEEASDGQGSVQCYKPDTGEWKKLLDCSSCNHIDTGVTKEHMVISKSNSVHRYKPYYWTSIHDSNLPGGVLDASLTQNGWVWAVARDGSPWRRELDTSSSLWTAAGTVWEAAGSGPYKKIAAIDESNAWAISSDSTQIKQTDNEGSTWTLVHTPENTLWKEIAAASDGSVWAISEDLDIYRFQPGVTNTYGEAWKQENSDDIKFMYVAVGDEKSVFAVSAVESEDGSGWVPGTAYEHLGVDPFFSSLSDEFEYTVKKYAQEPLGCAAELFFNDDKRKTSVYESENGFTLQQPWHNEKFVFGQDGDDPRAGCVNGVCDMSNYRIPTAVDTDDSCSSSTGRNCARDEFGQLRSNQYESAGFRHEAYNHLLQDYKDCAYELMADFDHQLAEALAGVRGPHEGQEIFNDEMDEFEEELHEKCVGDAFADRIDAGLQLVFGQEVSPGFICGVKEAIITRDHAMPGYCCLDAPYELSGDNWGQSYDCATATTCQRMGPYFAGMSTEACDAHGGTWCPLPADCSTLKNCMEEDANRWESKHPAYVEHLRLAPKITDSTDSEQCGRTRQYFGYSENFLNDQAICDDMNELRFSKDFAFMDKFHASKGTSKGSKAGDFSSVYQEVKVEPITVEDIEVEDVDVENIEVFEIKVEDIFVGELESFSVPGLSFDGLSDEEYESKYGPKADNGMEWRATLFALRQYVERAWNAVEYVADQKCPADCTGAVQTACAGVSNVMMAVAHAIYYSLQAAFDIMEFNYGEQMEVGNREPLETHERVQEIQQHMLTTGRYLKERFADQTKLMKNNYELTTGALKEHHLRMAVGLKQHHKYVGLSLKQHHAKIGEALENHHENIGDALKDHHENIGEALESHHDNIGQNLATINENVKQGATLHQVEVLQDDVTNLKVFELQVEVVANDITSKRVLVTTTFQGSRVDMDESYPLVIQGVGAEGFVSVSFTEVFRDQGMMVLDLSDTTPTVYTFDASYYDSDMDKQYKQTKIVSFGIQCDCQMA